MKYVVLMAATEGDWGAAGPEERQQVMEAHTAFHAAVTQRAAMLAGEALADSSRARTLRHRDGEAVLTEGPFAETAEQVGGLYLVDLPTLEDAVETSAGPGPAWSPSRCGGRPVEE